MRRQPLRAPCRPIVAVALVVAWVLVCHAGSLRAEEPITFRRDVMAVLSKAGCNAGVCHGNLNGKGGLKLSLRGQDPDADYRTLTRDLAGRRVDLLLPESSLLVRKPLALVSHEGGRRFTTADPEYRVLRQWIADGCRDERPAALRSLEVRAEAPLVHEPRREARLTATATFADGTTRDVTRAATYETTTRPVRVSADGVLTREQFGEATVLVRYLDQQQPVTVAFLPPSRTVAWPADLPEVNLIDRHVFAKLRTLQVAPAPRADDGVFLRRAYLDLVGTLPEPDEARAFLDSRAADKRTALVERLLKRPEFADFWAQKWADVLRIEERTVDGRGTKLFYDWARRGLAENKPLDRFVRELVRARGSTYKVPEANFYRAHREPTTRGEAAAQVFLGVRLQCARCHNHPFDRWTQADYYGWAAAFAPIEYKVVKNDRVDKNDKHQFDGEQLVEYSAKEQVIDPRTGKPAPPRLLGGPALENRQPADELADTAAWLTAEDNRRFARAQVNRVWYHLLGRGLVDPVDDLRASNPASHPALLEELAAAFAARKFDLRWLIREITRSTTYQLASEAPAGPWSDPALFAAAVPRRLPAEPLFDALCHVTGGRSQFEGYDRGTRAGALPGTQAMTFYRKAPQGDDAFLRCFGKPPRLLNSETERSDDVALAQVFQLVSGPSLARLLAEPDNRLGRWLKEQRPAEEIVEELYLCALCRRPTADERRALAEHLERADDRRAALEDLVWAVVNGKEFLLRF